MHQGSVLSPFLQLNWIDVTELTREHMLSKLPYVDDSALMSERIEELRNKFRNIKRFSRASIRKLTLGKPR